MPLKAVQAVLHVELNIVACDIVEGNFVERLKRDNVAFYKVAKCETLYMLQEMIFFRQNVLHVAPV